MSLAILLIAVALPALALAAAASDVLTMKIPNALPLGIAALFVPFALAAGLGAAEAGLHAATGFGALLFGTALFGFRLIGGGDAKLFAALALWTGMDGLWPFLLYTTLAGGGLALALVCFRALPLIPAIAGHGWVARLHRPGGGAPYGVALAAGALIALPKLPVFAAALA